MDADTASSQKNGFYSNPAFQITFDRKKEVLAH
jgi:hypothetical protein